MIRRLITFTLFILLYIISSQWIHAQISKDKKDYYTLFDKFIGIENTGLFEGYEYKERYVTKDGNHKYYLTDNYVTGDLVYDGQPYYKVELKYDIYKDELIIKLHQGKQFSVLRLIKEKVETFTIDTHSFKRLVNETANFSNGFYELAYHGNKLVLFKKHNKERIEHLDKEFAYSQFKYTVNYILYYHNEYYLINSKRSLIKLFPGQKKSIHSLYSINKRSLEKESIDLKMINLMKIIDNDLIDKN